MIKVHCVTVGLLAENCYLVHEDGRNDAVVIDPGDDGDAINAALTAYGLMPAAVLVTHGHFDHVNAANMLARRGCKIYMSKADEPLIRTDMNMGALMGGKFVPFEPDVYVRDGDVVDECGMRFRVMATPGHTIGGVCYICDEDKIVFTGDTLFCLGIGRSDLPTGNGRELEASVRKLYALDGDYTVYPGHGGRTTLEYERKYNPYV